MTTKQIRQQIVQAEDTELEYKLAKGEFSERVQPDEIEMTLGIEDSQESNQNNDPKIEKWPEKVVQILRIINEDRNTTIPQLEEALHLGHTTLKKILKEMQNENLIRRIGPANGGRGHWEIITKTSSLRP